MLVNGRIYAVAENCGIQAPQQLYIEKAGLPSTLINQIKRLAAFQNPEFYKKQIRVLRIWLAREDRS